MSADLLVISTSLNPDSKSRVLANEAFVVLRSLVGAESIDLALEGLPVCDGDSVYSDERVIALSTKIKESRAVLLAVPIYNFAAAATTKNLIELTGQAWEDKIVGFLCAAGGKSSYMSVMGLANSLMLDFHCVIVPRFVYADSNSFGASGLEDVEIKKRIQQLIQSTLKIAALEPVAHTRLS
jgi:NAD(P)H-dependent FMN reductase